VKSGVEATGEQMAVDTASHFDEDVFHFGLRRTLYEPLSPTNLESTSPEVGVGLGDNGTLGK